MMDNFPMRVKKVLIINPPSIIETIISTVRLFMKKKIMDRISIVSREEILEFIDADQLSQEMGGNIEYSINNFITYTDNIYSNYTPIEFKTVRRKKKKNNKLSNSMRTRPTKGESENAELSQE